MEFQKRNMADGQLAPMIDGANVCENGIRPLDTVALMNQCDVAWIMAAFNAKPRRILREKEKQNEAEEATTEMEVEPTAEVQTEPENPSGLEPMISGLNVSNEEPLPQREPRRRKDNTARELSPVERQKNLILRQAPTFPKLLVTLDTVELRRFQNSFPAVCQEHSSIPKVQEIVATGRENYLKQPCLLKAWIFDENNSFVRWSTLRESYRFPHKEINLDELISYKIPIPTWSLESLDLENLPREREAIKRVHNWVSSLDGDSQKRNSLSIWLESVLKGVKPDPSISTKEQPNGYFVDWEAVDRRKGLSQLITTMVNAKRELAMAYDHFNTKRCPRSLAPFVKAPIFHSSALKGLAATVKANTEAMFLNRFLMERLFQCNQDFNQTVIEFEKAYMRVINHQIYGFIQSVNVKVENFTAWAATNFARGVASELNFQLISSYLSYRDGMRKKRKMFNWRKKKNCKIK
jgi:hypothetical protein